MNKSIIIFNNNLFNNFIMFISYSFLTYFNVFFFSSIVRRVF